MKGKRSYMCTNRIRKNSSCSSHRSHPYLKMTAKVKTLVEQQKNVLERYVGDICEVQDICGSASNSLMCLSRQLIDIVGVVVVTPQIILNMLEAKPEKGYEDVFDDFRLTIFSMIVFDEAHHANDQHPYNVIMQSYHSLSESIGYDQGRDRKLPQVIALTASLGIGNSSTKLAEAIKHALMMCANLAANTIRNEELHFEFSDEIVLVDANDFHNLGFYKALVKELTFLEEEVLSVPEARIDVSLRNALSKSNATHLHQSYETGYESRAKLMQCFDRLLMFYHAIELLRLFGIATSLSYIEEEEKSYLATKSSQTTNHIKATLTDLRRQLKSDSSMFNALIEILNKQFSEREGSRVLIFALTRFQCKCLASLLGERTGFSSDFLTGQASTDESGKTKICVSRQWLKKGWIYLLAMWLSNITQLRMKLLIFSVEDEVEPRKPSRSS
uniref:Helicase ATP-binding domain-containing protein n=1 Tax=Ditylenchus dipsaci TaxID=166011 RepID=A0A915E2L4_9BILA